MSEEIISERRVNPRPASRKLVFMTLGLACLGIVGVGVGTGLAINIGNNTAHTVEKKSLQRDAQFRHIQQENTKLTNEIQAIEVKTNKAICTLIISSIEQAQKTGQQINPPVFVFVRSLGCDVPKSLQQH